MIAIGLLWMRIVIRIAITFRSRIIYGDHIGGCCRIRWNICNLVLANQKKKSVSTIFAHCAILLSNNYHGISCCHHVSALGLRLKAKHLPQQWNMAIRMLARHSDLIAVFRFCKCKIKKLLKQKMLTTHFAAPKLQQSRPHIYLYNCDRFWILVCTSSHIVSIPISFSSSAISA